MKLLNSYDRAIQRWDAKDENRNNFRADDSIWNHSELRSDGMRLRITTPADFSGTKRAITRWDWEQQLSLSRQLFARVGELAGALRQKATYVIGDSWQPQFQGRNQDWGREVENWLSEYWFEVANIRGEPFDFITSLFVDSVAIDRDGDAGMLTLTVDRVPKVQFIHAGRIAFRNGISQDQNGWGIVPDGRFKGARCYNGAIFDRNSAIIGYNILGEDAKSDMQVDVSQFQLLYDPMWSDQGRGIPATAGSLKTWMNYEDIVHFIQRQVKQDSALGLMHYNEEGSAPTLSAADFMQSKDSGAENQDVLIEQLEGNEVMYFKAQGGGKIEAIKSDRPHPNVDAHNMRLLRGAFLQLGWFYELYDPSAVGGASTRLIQDGARFSVNRKQALTWKRYKRALFHALSVGMANGSIPRNEDSDWMNWNVTLPAKITVDARYDDKTRMEKVRGGFGTHADLYGDEAKNWKPQITQWLIEEAWWQSEAKRLKVDLKEARVRFPNIPSEPTAEPEEKEETK